MLIMNTLNFSISKILSDDEGKNCRCLKKSQIELENGELWRKFHSLGLEMIVTKSGRRMFPFLTLRIKGLEARMKYSLKVEFNLVTSKKYRYSFHQSKWVSCGSGDETSGNKVFVHPDSPALGSYWMRHVVSFEKLKLTNNLFDRNGHIVVNSMQKYNVVFKLITHDEIEVSKNFVFCETEFMAVTAYQNHQITQLKIQTNPFAKGFREIDNDLLLRHI